MECQPYFRFKYKNHKIIVYKYKDLPNMFKAVILNSNDEEIYDFSYDLDVDDINYLYNNATKIINDYDNDRFLHMLDDLRSIYSGTGLATKATVDASFDDQEAIEVENHRIMSLNFLASEIIEQLIEYIGLNSLIVAPVENLTYVEFSKSLNELIDELIFKYDLLKNYTSFATFRNGQWVKTPDDAITGETIELKLKMTKHLQDTIVETLNSIAHYFGLELKNQF